MSYDPSISLQGLRNAATLLERAARTIARPPAQAPCAPDPADSFQTSGAQSVPDYPAELVRMLQAKACWRSNVRALECGLALDSPD